MKLCSIHKMKYFMNIIFCYFLFKYVVINIIIAQFYLLVNMHNDKSCYCFFVHLYKIFYYLEETECLILSVLETERSLHL